MLSFKLDEYGDLKVENGEIEMITGNELLYQKVRQVLSTNLGEYTLEPEQGISFKNLLSRKLNEDLVRDEILRGLRQVDPTFTIEEFEERLEEGFQMYYTYVRNRYLLFKTAENCYTQKLLSTDPKNPQPKMSMLTLKRVKEIFPYMEEIE